MVTPAPPYLQMVDDNHPCCGMKYIRNKPVKDLCKADFLHLHQAEADGLLELRISIDLEQGVQDKRGAGPQSYFEEIRQLFYRVDTCSMYNYNNLPL